MTFQWTAGSRFSADADKVGKELRAAGKKHTTESILRLARSAKTELHKCFLWDDKEAAHQHRLETARRIGRSLVIEEEVAGRPGETMLIRAFECVSEEFNGGSRTVYIPTREALSDDDMRVQVFKRLADDIASASATTLKYRALLGPTADRVAKHLSAAEKALAVSA